MTAPRSPERPRPVLHKRNGTGMCSIVSKLCGLRQLRALSNFCNRCSQACLYNISTPFYALDQLFVVSTAGTNRFAGSRRFSCLSGWLVMFVRRSNTTMQLVQSARFNVVASLNWYITHPTETLDDPRRIAQIVSVVLFQSLFTPVPFCVSACPFGRHYNHSVQWNSRRCRTRFAT